MVIWKEHARKQSWPTQDTIPEFAREWLRKNTKNLSVVYVKVKVKFSPLQALEAVRVVKG
jgi:hypothetical protein